MKDETTPGGRAEDEALEEMIGAVAKRMRDRPVPDLTSRVLSRITELERAAEPSLWERLDRVLRLPWVWLWTPRPLMLRPAYAFGAAFLIAVSLVVVPPVGSRAEVASAEIDATTGSPAVYVQFRLDATGASDVALVGSFTGWEPVVEMRETVPGVWSVLLPLTPGVHDYAFLVDGTEWIVDPHALQVDDGFGGLNSRIALASVTTS